MRFTPGTLQLLQAFRDSLVRGQFGVMDESRWRAFVTQAHLERANITLDEVRSFLRGRLGELDSLLWAERYGAERAALEASRIDEDDEEKDQSA
jgi:hypothetical protein